MKMILLVIAILALSACEPNADVNVSGGTQNSVTVKIERTEFKQVNGLNYVRVVDGLNDYCLAIDSSTAYPVNWVSLETADLNRLTAYVAEETLQCSQ